MTQKNTLSADDLDMIRNLDTCAVSNAIERFNVRLRNEGFVHGPVHCQFPGLQPMLGYAAPAGVRCSNRPMTGRCYYDRMDWWECVPSLPVPRVMVLQDVDQQAGIGALVGEVHAQIGLALHCVGCVTNGAVRDLPAVEKAGFHLFAGSIAVSHSYAYIVDFGEPVEIGSLQIRPGDVIHGDRHGVHTIPGDIAHEIPEVAAGLAAEERASIDLCPLRDFRCRSWPPGCGKRIMNDPVGSVATRWKSEPMIWLHKHSNGRNRARIKFLWPAGCLAVVVAGGLAGCVKSEKVRAESEAPNAVTVGVVKIGRKTLERELTVSSELVPFQEVDVYAKESGYVHDLLVDYGTRVKKGQVMAVLEIPELEVQLQQDDAATRNASDQVTHAEHELGRVEAQHKVLHLQFERLNGVAKSRPGLVAQQEVDDSQGKDLAAEAQVEGTKSSLQAAQSQLQAAQAKKEHDRVLFNYSRITAPFTGVVTQRYANLGTLLQAGTSSSTQAMPLVRISEDDLFRLVIPVPESYVRYIHVGDPVKVIVPSLNRGFPGKVTRFSVDVKEDTRTMHTEVDVPNLDHVLMPGLYAEAALSLERKVEALFVPLQAVNHEGTQTTAYVVNQQNKIEDRKLILGLQTANEAGVLSGLNEGDQVVVSDRSGLKPGEDVRPQVVEMLQYQGEKEE